MYTAGETQDPFQALSGHDGEAQYAPARTQAQTTGALQPGRRHRLSSRTCSSLSWSPEAEERLRTANRESSVLWSRLIAQ